jgi:hypothetical protein
MMMKMFIEDVFFYYEFLYLLFYDYIEHIIQFLQVFSFLIKDDDWSFEMKITN